MSHSKSQPPSYPFFRPSHPKLRPGEQYLLWRLQHYPDPQDITLLHDHLHQQGAFFCSEDNDALEMRLTLKDGTSLHVIARKKYYGMVIHAHVDMKIHSEVEYNAHSQTFFHALHSFLRSQHGFTILVKKS